MISQHVLVAALLSTTLISLAPNVLLVLFPQYASGEGRASPILKLGQALAAGGLLGDVFLHTLPHASSSDSSSGLWLLSGFFLFLLVDMLMRSIGHKHSHSVEQHHSSHNNSSTVTLNLAADALHNFTDGLAIGASFSIGGNTTIHAAALTGDDETSFNYQAILSLLQSRGGLATLSILFHEIPHELGDFAILVQHGFSKQQAILAQFGTAVAAMIGTVAGLYLEDALSGETLLLVTAGGFVYLAATNIIPELLDDHEASLKFRLMQLFCFASGIGFLYAVTFLEEMGGHHHHAGEHSHGQHQHHHEQIRMEARERLLENDHHSDNHHAHEHAHHHEL